jgi:DNA-binding transcriptional ArsR family regulator
MSVAPTVTGCSKSSPRWWRLVTDAGEDVFGVLADPTRRRILDLLAEHQVRSVSQLAAEFPDLVASGISKHLMALRAAGLVTATRQGRNRLYRIDADGFARALGPWVAKYEAYWSGSLEALRALAESSEQDQQ